MKRLFVSIHNAMDHVESGDVLLFRGKAWLSRLIEAATGGPYSHAAMAWNDYSIQECMEVREWYGGRCRPLGPALLEAGPVDVFRVREEFRHEFNLKGSAEYMRALTARRYGYGSVLSLGLRRIPGVWWAFARDISDDRRDDGKAPFCSQAIALAAQFGGGIDPAPNKPARLVTPNDLAWSLLFRYQFSVR